MGFGFRNEFIVCRALGYPDPFSPTPNTIEAASKFQRKHGGQIRRRVVSNWEDVDVNPPLESSDDEITEVCRGDVWYHHSMQHSPVTIVSDFSDRRDGLLIGVDNRGRDVFISAKALLEKGKRLWPLVGNEESL